MTELFFQMFQVCWLGGVQHRNALHLPDPSVQSVACLTSASRPELKMRKLNGAVRASACAACPSPAPAPPHAQSASTRRDMRPRFRMGRRTW